MSWHDDREVEAHPSYGVIGWSKIRHGVGNKTHLFQSELEHMDTVSIRINRAYLERSLHRDWVMEKDHVIEVEMSAYQFSEFITCPNQQGVPCTISWTEKDGKIERQYKDTRYKKFKDEVASDFEEIKKSMEHVVALAEAMKESKGSLKRGNFNSLVSAINMLKQDLFSNLPFLREQMDRHMASVVASGKVEIEAFLTERLQEKGLEALQADGPKLIEHED